MELMKVMKLEKANGSIYSSSRSENVSQSENSSASLSISDSDEALVEEQEPSSSGISNEFCSQIVSNGVRQSTCTWAKRQYQPTSESLHDEVMDLYLWLKPTAEEIFLRREVFHRVAEQLKLLFPYAEVAMFGSVATNLFLPSSDIDISINLCNYTANNLYQTAETFSQLDTFENINVLDRASVPIVKLRDKQTRFYIDISFNVHKNVLRNVAFLNKKKHLIIELEPLVLVLKQFLVQHGLNHPFNGGLSSYGLILMVMGFLKFYPRRSLSKNCLGLLLFEFFRFYGLLFDYAEYGISVRNNQTSVLRKEDLAKSMNEDKCSSFLFIEDPIQRNNNVGKSAHNMIAVKDAFAEAANSICAAFLQCQYADQEFVQNYYYGPMISLIVSFSDEEINYRKFQKKLFLRYSKDNTNTSCNSTSPKQNSDLEKHHNTFGKKIRQENDSMASPKKLLLPSTLNSNSFLPLIQPNLFEFSSVPPLPSSIMPNVFSSCNLSPVLLSMPSTFYTLAPSVSLPSLNPSTTLINNRIIDNYSLPAQPTNSEKFGSNIVNANGHCNFDSTFCLDDDILRCRAGGGDGNKIITN